MHFVAVDFAVVDVVVVDVVVDLVVDDEFVIAFVVGGDFVVIDVHLCCLMA